MFFFPGIFAKQKCKCHRYEEPRMKYVDAGGESDCARRELPYCKCKCHDACIKHCKY